MQKKVVEKECTLGKLIIRVLNRTPINLQNLFVMLISLNKKNSSNVRKAVEAWDKSLA